jgi:hypothetical protein
MDNQDFTDIDKFIASQKLASQPRERKQFPILSIEDMEIIPENDYLIPKLIQKQSLSVLYAPSGHCKSFLALDICLRLAYGMDWRGKEMDAVDVLYIAAEGAHGMRKRVRAWRIEHGFIDEKIKNTRLKTITAPVNLLDKTEVDDLIYFIENLPHKFAFVVIDTLARSMVGGDENSAAAMGVAVASADRIKENFECAVMLIHHTGKDVSRGARGSYNLKCSLETELFLERDKDDKNKLRLFVSKQKDDEDGYWIEGISVKEIDIKYPDHMGDPRHSLVVVHDTNEPSKSQMQSQARIHGDQQAIASVMQDGQTLSQKKLIAGMRATQLQISDNTEGSNRLKNAIPANMGDDTGYVDITTTYDNVVKRVSRMGTKFSCKIMGDPRLKLG